MKKFKKDDKVLVTNSFKSNNVTYECIVKGYVTIKGVEFVLLENGELYYENELTLIT